MKKAPSKSASSGVDDKKLQTALKKMNVQPIQAIEEVNMFKEDGNVIHFAAPKGTLSNNLIYPYPFPFQSIMAFPAALNGPPTNIPLTQSSPCLRPKQHIRNLRQRRRQRANRAGPGDSQPTRPGQPGVPATAGRELPEHAEEGGRQGRRGRCRRR
jgi:hypothetical protein